MDLSLDLLTLTDSTLFELINSAHEAGFPLVSLWTQPPAFFPRQIVTAQNVRDCAALLADTGVRVHAIEVFELSSEEAIAGYRPALELAAMVGGKAAVAKNTTHRDPARAAALLAALAELAGEYGIGVNIEPLSMGHTRTLAQARDLIEASGADVGIDFDTLHFARVGGTATDIAAIPSGLIRYVQINDGPAAAPTSVEGLRAEAALERLYPGEGVFPLLEWLPLVPTDIPWAIETPSVERARSMLPTEQARQAMQIMQRFLARLGLADSAGRHG